MMMKAQEDEEEKDKKERKRKSWGSKLWRMSQKSMKASFRNMISSLKAISWVVALPKAIIFSDYVKLLLLIN